jgi:hypothetical protein
VRGEGEAEVAGQGRGDPQQTHQRAGHEQDDRDAARLAGGDLGAEADGDLSGVTELADRRQPGASAGGSPVRACASVASSSPDRSSATMPAWARAGPGSRAVTSAR